MRKIKREIPFTMLIQEIKIPEESLRSIARKFWKRCREIALDAKGLLGGLEILWNLQEIQFDNWLAMKNARKNTFHYLG